MMPFWLGFVPSRAAPDSAAEAAVAAGRRARTAGDRSSVPEPQSDESTMSFSISAAAAAAEDDDDGGAAAASAVRFKMDFLHRSGTLRLRLSVFFSNFSTDIPHQ